MAGGDVVLITGTTSGFGRLLAEACALQGYTVYASMREATGRNAKARQALEGLATTAGVSLQVLELELVARRRVGGNGDLGLVHAAMLSAWHLTVARPAGPRSRPRR